jgi:ribosomal protein S18 acetylase RimI-like enzyme
MEGKITIRNYQDSDQASVAKLWATVFPDDLPWNAPSELIHRKKHAQPELFWIAQLDGEIVGTILAGYDGVRGWIYHLAVDPAQRRQGTARLLMQTAEASLEALGCPKINLQVRMQNRAAVAFYKALGYGIEERIQMGKPIGKFRRS